jgi:hypothetical protein
MSYALFNYRSMPCDLIALQMVAARSPRPIRGPFNLPRHTQRPPSPLAVFFVWQCVSSFTAGCARLR